MNAAVRADGRGLSEALSGLGLRLGRGEERRCLEELLAVRANRSRAEGEDMELWMEDIQEAVEITQSRAGNSKNAALKVLLSFYYKIQILSLPGYLPYIISNCG